MKSIRGASRAFLLLIFVSVVLLAQVKTKTAQKKLDVKGPNASPSASATYTLFPYSDTIEGMNPRQIGECACGSNQVTFSPTSVVAKANTPVQIRYDASTICNKQTIRDLNGTVHAPVDQIGNLTLGSVQWEIGAVSDLPLEWGIITYDSGYAQPTQERIQIDIKLQCYDTGPNCTAPGHYQICPATGTIPVTVTP